MRLLLIVLLLGPPTVVRAQPPAETRARTSLYVEVLGNGGFNSWNVEYEVLPRAGLRVGFGTDFSDGDFQDQRLITIPVMLNYRIGDGTGTLELGGGMLLGQRRIVEEGSGDLTISAITSLTATIGYRRQPPRGGLVLRAGFTPFLSLNSPAAAYPDPGFTPSIGLSVGYAF